VYISLGIKESTEQFINFQLDGRVETSDPLCMNKFSISFVEETISIVMSLCQPNSNLAKQFSTVMSALTAHLGSDLDVNSVYLYMESGEVSMVWDQF
jgi:hypothetical protein